MIKLSEDTTDLIFRSLFCLIFICLGFEHLFSDKLIQELIPSWLPAKRFISVFCGFWLIFWGCLIAVGYKVNWSAIALGGFIIIVSLLVHLPALFYYPELLAEQDKWLWDVLQRSNLVKNICLLGVCFLLLNYKVKKYSLEYLVSFLRGRRSRMK